MPSPGRHATDDAAVRNDAVDDDVRLTETTAESSWFAPEGDVVTEVVVGLLPEGGAVATDDSLPSDRGHAPEESILVRRRR